MKKILLRIKVWWHSFKKWIIGLVVILCTILGGVHAATVNFTYRPATSYVDGSPMALSDIDFTRLYCNSVMVDEESGADGDFSVILGFGTYVCTATHVVLIATTQESVKSDSVTRIVRPGQPSSPEDLQ